MVGRTSNSGAPDKQAWCAGRASMVRWTSKCGEADEHFLCRIAVRLNYCFLKVPGFYGNKAVGDMPYCFLNCYYEIILYLNNFPNNSPILSRIHAMDNSCYYKKCPAVSPKLDFRFFSFSFSSAFIFCYFSSSYYLSFTIPLSKRTMHQTL